MGYGVRGSSLMGYGVRGRWVMGYGVRGSGVMGYGVRGSWVMGKETLVWGTYGQEVRLSSVGTMRDRGSDGGVGNWEYQLCQGQLGSGWNVTPVQGRVGPSLTLYVI